jgi:hypothetical protein
MELDLEQIKADFAAGRTDRHTVRQLIAEVERLQTRLQALEQRLDKLAQFRPGELSDRPDEGFVSHPSGLSKGYSQGSSDEVARRGQTSPRSEWPGE